MKLCGAFALLDAVDGVALGFEVVHCLEGGGEVLPCHGVFGSEGGLVDFGVGWLGGDTAQVDGLDAEGVGGAEHAAHVVHAPHVVEHDDEGHLF